MPEQALYLKWRPISFDDMVGQEHIVRTLRNALKTGRIRHAYLFSGPRGTGKTTSARLLAKAVNCLDPDPENRPCNACHTCIAVNEGRYLDLIEIDAATHTGVDDVRDLRDKIAFSPGEGRYKVYIIDEVHRFTGNAFDALLKTLEEPPNHAIFVLATTEIGKVPQTIKSRCLQFEFRRLSLRELTDRLVFITENEGLKIERAALELVARYGTGSARDSISLLDQIVSDPDEEITLEMVQQVLGTANLRAVRSLVGALIDQDASAGLHIINTAVDNGSDPAQFAQQVIEHLRAVLLAQTASADLIDATDEDRLLYEQQSSMISRQMLLAAVRAFNEMANNYKGGWQPQLGLELAFLESIQQPEAQALPDESTSHGQTTTPRPEISEPGAPPVLPISVLKERWSDTLKALHRRNATAPAVVAHFQPTLVEGNLVTLSTTDAFLLERLQVPEKIHVVEQALFDIHRIALRVRLSVGGSKPAPADAIDPDDPVIAAGLELGGELREE